MVSKKVQSLLAVRIHLPPGESLQTIGSAVADGWHVPRCRHHFVAAQTSSATLRLIAELGDLPRFANPRQLMAYLGLVPSEHSSGASVKRGGLTKLDDNRLLMGATNNRVS